MIYRYIASFLLMPVLIYTISFDMLIQKINKNHPFDYNLDIIVIPAKNVNADAIICCHGYGHSNKIAQRLASNDNINNHIIGFNFPDYNCLSRPFDHSKAAFGTINEILPLLYLAKQAVVDAGNDKINLYGFSAGGGAIINMLSILNQNKYDDQLKTLGIDQSNKKQILTALQNGLIILDCPLKSIEEIIDLRGEADFLLTLAQNYKTNNMRPIDAIKNLQGLSLNILLHFQKYDEILGNRDDQEFINRLRTYIDGTTHVVLGTEGGHNSYHKSLWDYYKALQK